MAERRAILARALGFSILNFSFPIGSLLPETFAKPSDEIHVFVEDGQDDANIFVPNEEDVMVLAAVNERICESFREGSPGSLFCRDLLQAGFDLRGIKGRLVRSPTDPGCIAGFVLCRIPRLW